MKRSKGIALIGPPGSGKSDLAKELASRLEDAVIVDDYMEEIARDSDLYLDEDATYIGNLYALLGRYAKERQADLDSSDPQWIISCGTLIETSVYATLEAVKEQDEVHWIRIQTFMNLIGGFYQDTWRYDHVFHLPLGKTDPDDKLTKIDVAIRMALEAFGVSALELEGTTKEKADLVIEALDLETASAK